MSVNAPGSLTARRTSRAAGKPGVSEPAVPSGRAVAQRIKGTPGITGLSPPIVHIDGAVWHLDVGSSHPGGGVPSKGSAVRRLKWYASWVQSVVRQFGLYPVRTIGNLRGSTPSTRGPGRTNLWCTGCGHRSE